VVDLVCAAGAKHAAAGEGGAGRNDWLAHRAAWRTYRPGSCGRGAALGVMVRCWADSPGWAACNRYSPTRARVDARAARSSTERQRAGADRHVGRCSFQFVLLRKALRLVLEWLKSPRIRVRARRNTKATNASRALIGSCRSGVVGKFWYLIALGAMLAEATRAHA
jgi:hypothetical protein